MSKKRKKKAIAKRRSQVKVKKQKKAKYRSSKSTQPVQFVDRPAISEIDTPKEFRAVSISQAMVEYVKPLIDFVEKGIVKDQNKPFQLGIQLWNYNLPKEHHNLMVVKEDLIKQIAKTLKMNSEEATELFDMMIQRKKYLFPDEVQSDNPMTVFIRKEERHIIPEFNYDLLNISEESYLPDDEDEKFVQLIDQMDKYIADDVDYGEWEDHYFILEEKCKKRFEKWLIFKGVKEYSKDFPYNIEIYLNFIYRYMHGDNINLKTVLPIYIEEFFVDHVLRKVITEPYDYVKWPPALKLFYNFLNEIGYLENPDKIIKLIDSIEPHFIKILRERFS